VSVCLSVCLFDCPRAVSLRKPAGRGRIRAGPYGPSDCTDVLPVSTEGIELFRCRLKVSCSRWDPADVQYTVREGPRHGRLTVGDVGGGGRARQFSQEDVDSRRVFYEHADRDQLADSFRFDVSCGSARRRGLEFGVDVVSSKIALDVAGNLTVPHRGSTTLTSNLLRVPATVQVRRAHRRFCSLNFRPTP